MIRALFNFMTEIVYQLSLFTLSSLRRGGTCEKRIIISLPSSYSGEVSVF